MKKALFFICYLIGFIIGAILLIFNAETLQRDQTFIRYDLIGAGVIFIIPAIVQLISSLTPKRDEFGNILPRKWYTTVVAILALLWGIYMLIFPTGYNDSLTITLGVSLILAGLAQSVWIVRTKESTFVRFIVPIITTLLGLVICIFIKDTTSTGKADQLAAILSGIMLIVWSVNGILSLRSKRVVAAADKAAKVERKAEKEEHKALKLEKDKESAETTAEEEKKEDSSDSSEDKSEEKKERAEQTDDKASESKEPESSYKVAEPKNND